MKTRKSAGFTLIEIMLVMVLLAMSAVAVVINLPDNRQDLAKEQAQRFFYRLQLLNEDAILNGQDFGIRVDEKKELYTYLSLTGEGWQPLDSRTFADTEMEEGINLSLEIGSTVWSDNESMFNQESLFDEEMFAEYEEEKKVRPPQLYVLSSGEITPFRLTLFPEGDAEQGWVVDVRESGSIELLRVRELEERAEPL